MEARVSDIFEEVEERLREDKLQTWVRKYGLVALGVAVGAVILVGLASAYEAWREQNNQSIGERFAAIQLQVENDPAAAVQALTEFEKSAHGGYKSLAEMERAGALQAQGDTAGALAAFDKAAQLANDPVVRQAAQLRAAYIAAETENFAAIEGRLQPIIEARGPMSYLARELLGVEAYEAHQTERARQEFSYLETAFEAPAGVRQRAGSFLQVLGRAPEATTPAPASPPPAAAAPEKSTGEKK
jgi:hypothetical protein